MEQRTAFVEVTYRDAGPSFAGSSAGSVHRSEVVEVKADSTAEAEKISAARIKLNQMAGGIQARFLRWA